MTKEEFENLQVDDIVRRLGVTYRVVFVSKDGCRELSAYKQTPTYIMYVHPQNTSFICKLHRWVPVKKRTKYD